MTPIQFAADRARVDRIKAIVASWAGTTPAMIDGPRRQKELLMARHVAVLLATELCPALSLPRLGLIFGGREHSTILHSRDRARALVAQPGEAQFIYQVAKGQLDAEGEILEAA